MSFKRKNAQRLKQLRRLGFPIDANYRVPDDAFVASGLDPAIFEGVDGFQRSPMAAISYIEPRGQRQLIERLTA